MRPLTRGSLSRRVLASIVLCVCGSALLAAEPAETVSNKSFPGEQEGFARTLVPSSGIPACGSAFNAHSYGLHDFRGPVPDSEGKVRNVQAYGDRTAVEWETTPAESAETTVFTWIGGAQVRPVRPAFPMPMATLSVDGTPRLRFPLGQTARSYVTNDEGFSLTIEPKRFQSLVEPPHRSWSPDGVSGFYRLKIPGEFLTAGKPVQVRVELNRDLPDIEQLFFVSPRSDALRVDLRVLRDEVARLQSDMVQLRQSHEMLYAQLYPQLFPKVIAGEVVIAFQDETRHFHPPSLTVMRDGEIVITCREATDHLARNGQMILVRSTDGGRTWSPREVMFPDTGVDHRAAPIVELPNGDWVTLDYRAGGIYDDAGIFRRGRIRQPTLWGAWSTDRGRTWNFSEEPLTVPGSAHPYAEAERHAVILPSGRLLAGANYQLERQLGTPTYNMAVFCSDDNGRSWQVLAKVPERDFVVGEPTLLRTQSGKILLVSRTAALTRGRAEATGSLLQSVSPDDGKTWSELREVGMSSMNTPAHLLQLQDGRILCTHASRTYPGSVYVTLSRDEGETWDTENTRIITNDLANFDSTYPTSGQLADGTLLTTWYANLFGKFYVAVKRYRPENLD